MQTKIMERYFFFGLLLSTFVFAIMIFRPFLSVLTISACLAVVLYPLYEWFLEKKFPDWIAAGIVVLFFVVVLFGPILAIGMLIFRQSQDLYQSVAAPGATGPFISSIGHWIHTLLPRGVTFDINQKVSELVSYITGDIAVIFTSTLSIIFSLFLTILALFYFLKDGASWKKALIILSPLSDANDEKILARLAHSINGIMKGYLLIALLQGVLLGLGMAIFGVPNPAFWAVVAGLSSLIPTVGTTLFSIPVIIFLYVTGHTIPALGFTIWAFILVGTIDNFLNPLIIGKKIAIPQILVLFSVLGGIALLGPVGMLLGPLTMSLLYALVSLYRNEFKPDEIV